MEHIIHIDNSEFFRKLMKTYLSEKGIPSESFSSVEDAMKAVNANEASCIITGMELADMTGKDFMKQLTLSGKKIPVIIVTSREEEAAKSLSAFNVKAIISKSGNWQKELDNVFD